MGLTGGIGAGKSTVARILAEHGAAVIDTDAIARELTAPGGAAHELLADRFGTVDRVALAELAFTDPAARRDLNAIVHPLVEALVRRRIEEVGESHDLVVVEVPLLVEAGWQGMFDAVVVVDVPEETAVERLVANRGMDPEDVRLRMAAQATREQRLAIADHVVANHGSFDDLQKRVIELVAQKDLYSR